MDKILVIILGILAAGFTYWFFLVKKEKEVEVSDSVDIMVEGGYSPQSISIPKGKQTVINFVRRDSNSCLEEVVIPDFSIKKYLPIGQKVSVKLNPEQSGEYKYSCGMGMYHGKIIVR